jgi:hypothetical protein
MNGMRIIGPTPAHVANLSSGVRVELPRLRAPIALLVDDPMPGLNPLYYHRKFFDGRGRPRSAGGQPLVRTIPLAFLDRFCDAVNQTGARGKFSVVPNPFGLGEIDRGFRDCPKRRCARFINTVRSRLGADFDITPEMVTHGHALDLDTGSRLPMNEDAWSKHQGVESLTRYLTHAAAILDRAGLDPNGFTSPWSFGSEVEAAYAEAAARAQQAVNGRALTWYFLAGSDRRRVMPRLRVLRRATREAVVHIVVGCPDHLWATQNTKRADEAYLRERAALYLATDGRGRIADLVDSGSFVAVLAHWQSLYSNGTEAGLAVLRRVFKRVNALLGRRAIWMKCSEMARYFAAAKTARARLSDDGFAVTSLFASPEFTVSAEVARRPARVMANGRALQAVESSARLRDGRWMWAAGRLFVCADMDERLAVRLSPGRRPR